VTNIQRSVVKVAPDLSKVLDIFTPSNQGNLDQTDEDFGSAGRFCCRRRKVARHCSAGNSRQGRRSPRRKYPAREGFLDSVASRSLVNAN
jgi:hypothetical protein